MMDPWDRAMAGLSDLELNLIMVGAKNGKLESVGSGGGYHAGLKAAMELARRDAETRAPGMTILAEIAQESDCG